MVTTNYYYEMKIKLPKAIKISTISYGRNKSYTCETVAADSLSTWKDQILSLTLM